MEDALNATRAAVEEGIIAGGGSAYIHASKKVAEFAATLEGDEKTGANVILKALEAPLYYIVANAGLEGSVIINKVKESKEGIGYDAYKEEYVDMVDRKSGCILNISSMNAYIPLTKIPAYSGAKAAVSNFTQWLATHFAGTGIRCNAIAPGFLVSNQNRRLLFNEDGTPTARSNKILSGTPTGRFVDSEELLGGVFFLCDDKAASAITGVVLPIDAGFAAYSGV